MTYMVAWIASRVLLLAMVAVPIVFFYWLYHYEMYWEDDRWS
jgi:hypothetical protein